MKIINSIVTHLLPFLIIASIFSCSKANKEEKDGTTTVDDVLNPQITIAATIDVNVSNTRTTYDDSGSSISYKWASDDELIVWYDGTFNKLKLIDGKGSARATFQGQIKGRPKSYSKVICYIVNPKYSSIYAFNSKKGEVTLIDSPGQFDAYYKQDGTIEGAFACKLYKAVSEFGSGSIDATFQCINDNTSIIKFKLTMPENVSVNDQIMLTVGDLGWDGYAVASFRASVKSGAIQTVYMAVPSDYVSDRCGLVLEKTGVPPLQGSIVLSEKLESGKMYTKEVTEFGSKLFGHPKGFGGPFTNYEGENFYLSNGDLYVKSIYPFTFDLYDNPFSGYEIGWGKRTGNGQSYFDWLTLGQYFSSTKVSESSSYSIDNKVQPKGLEGTAIPTLLEWHFLISDKERKGSVINGSKASHYRYSLVKLTHKGYGGLIIFPDNASISLSSAPRCNSWEYSSVSEEDFNSMIDAGCVFLPTSGWSYHENGIDNWKEAYQERPAGWYWSSSSYSISSYYEYASSIFFYEGCGEYNIADAANKSNVFLPVRLVKHY